MRTARRELRIPLAVDENGRDFSARIEAQVTDAANREVSGRTIVHATYGTFLLSARNQQLSVPRRQPVDIAIRAIDYPGTPQPNVPVTLTLEHLAISLRLLRASRGHVDRDAARDHDADGRATASLHAAQSHRQLPRPRDRAERRAHRAGPGLPVGAGSERWHRADRRSLSGAAVRQKNYQPGESATLIVRGETVIGPVLVTKEGQHVVVVPPAAADAHRRDPSADRRGRCRRCVRQHRLPARRPLVSRRTAPWRAGSLADAAHVPSPRDRRCRARAIPACST